MNRLENDWKPTRYRSRHPCWGGSDLVVLPHMGYMICNGVVWTRCHPYDWQDRVDGEIHSIHSLREMIKYQVIHEGHEIFVCRRPAFALNRRRIIGLRGLFCEIEGACNIRSGFYDVHEDTMHTRWSTAITDCSAFIQSKTRIIQRLFRRRRTPVHMWNIRKIKTFQDSVSCLPIDVIKHITESFVKSLDSSHGLDRNQYSEMLTIETELFKQTLVQ
jgi:hypothetical protein